MAVDLAEYESEVPDDAADTSRRIDRSTAQALIAALAALAVATLVVTATANALVRPGAGDSLGAQVVPVVVDLVWGASRAANAG